MTVMINTNNKDTSIRKRYKISELTESDKLSICHKKPLLMFGNANSDIGLCSKCKKLSFDIKNRMRLKRNRYQSFKKIADDGLYNNTWRRASNNYFTPKRKK